MLIWYFSNNLDIFNYVGKLTKQHFSVWLFSNPGDNILFLLKFSEARISELNIPARTFVWWAAQTSALVFAGAVAAIVIFFNQTPAWHCTEMLSTRPYKDFNMRTEDSKVLTVVNEPVSWHRETTLYTVEAPLLAERNSTGSTLYEDQTHHQNKPYFHSIFVNIVWNE